MDEDIVLYRTRDGRPRAVHPYCPHLGAHLGAGGAVEGQNLVCPFHRFAFAPDGTCVGTPDGPPPRARLQHHSISERNGFLFAWYEPDGAPPTWEIPGTAQAGVVPTAAWSTEVAVTDLENVCPRCTPSASTPIICSAWACTTS